ncbi:hypothetical protein [Algicella marina]|uniref:Glycosyltransferase RgtA/B/C/D-like domain-containing protein n=1 Tax=Algicella marina TaxID=2683284 RepID=A0A6P1T0U1_9RHOB|nr:hypothetical protein [Algicella marina]QHQ35617.1 hypothetical protein GO499_10725 [Algicella marina]
MPAAPRVSPATAILAALALFALAYVLRVIGIDWGYSHGDERINIAAKVLTGQLVPDNHYYPPLYDYINAAILGVLFVFGKLTGLWASTGEFRDAYFTDDTVFYLAVRMGTAFFAAMVAPLFFLVARGLRLPLAACLATGLAGVFLPTGVILSHIAKSDVPLATTGILLILLILARLRTDRSLALDLALGLAIALGISFKQTFVLLAAPMLLVLTVLLIRRIGIGPTLAAAGRALLVAIICIPIFNIGIFLDLENFLDYQAIQSVMSMRDDAFLASALVTLKLVLTPTNGLSAIGFLLYLVFPLAALAAGSALPQRGALLLLWACTLLTALITIAIVGTRQHNGLWIMDFTAMQLFAGLSVAALMVSASSMVRPLGLAAAAALLVFTGLGIWEINRQALATPIKQTVAEFLRESYPNSPILTLARLDFPKTPEVQAFLVSRDERLAEKYDVVLPEVAAERAAPDLPADALQVLHKPIILWGLENATDEDLEGAVQAFAWPGQPEEWTVQYWQDLGYEVFITANLPFALSGGNGRYVQAYAEDLVAQCEVVLEVEPVKTLYIEDLVTVFDCPDTAS